MVIVAVSHEISFRQRLFWRKQCTVPSPLAQSSTARASSQQSLTSVPCPGVVQRLNDGAQFTQLYSGEKATRAGTAKEHGVCATSCLLPMLLSKHAATTTTNLSLWRAHRMKDTRPKQANSRNGWPLPPHKYHNSEIPFSHETNTHK